MLLLLKIILLTHTAAVYRGFFRLKPDFTHRYWAGFRDRTHPFGLAVSGVFIKQTVPTCHCNLRFPLSRKPQASLLPKLRDQFRLNIELAKLKQTLFRRNSIFICRFPWAGFSQHPFAFSAIPPVFRASKLN